MLINIVQIDFTNNLFFFVFLASSSISCSPKTLFCPVDEILTLIGGSQENEKNILNSDIPNINWFKSHNLMLVHLLALC